MFPDHTPTSFTDKTPRLQFSLGLRQVLDHRPAVHLSMHGLWTGGVNPRWNSLFPSVMAADQDPFQLSALMTPLLGS